MVMSEIPIFIVKLNNLVLVVMPVLNLKPKYANWLHTMTSKEAVCLLCNGGNGGESHAINIAAFRDGFVVSK